MPTIKKSIITQLEVKSGPTSVSIGPAGNPKVLLPLPEELCTIAGTMGQETISETTNHLSNHAERIKTILEPLNESTGRVWTAPFSDPSIWFGGRWVKQGSVGGSFQVLVDGDPLETRFTIGGREVVANYFIEIKSLD